MEQIYKPRVQTTTNANEFFERFHTNGLFPDGVTTIPKTDKEFMQAMNFTETDCKFDELMRSVDLDKMLIADDEMRIYDYDPQSPNSNKLQQTIELNKDALKLNNVQDMIGKLSKPRHRIVHRNYRYIGVETKHECDDNVNLKYYDEVVITVRFYGPFRHISSCRNILNPRFREEFLVLGSTPLTALRDKIYCQCNFGPFPEISKNPFEVDQSGSDKINSGFFYIQGTFYNDMRDPRNHDYSDVILRWAKDEPECTEMKKEKMEGVLFKDLNFKLGYPQVYQHHGNCEHLFVFSCVRLLHKGDSRLSSNYPLPTRLANFRYRYCSICGRHEAHFLVRNSPAHVQDPSYLCRPCFESYHYVDGKKVGSFNAYRYYGVNAFRFNDK